MHAAPFAQGQDKVTQAEEDKVSGTTLCGEVKRLLCAMMGIRVSLFSACVHVPPPLRPPRSLPPTPQSYPEQVHSIDMMLSTGHTPTIDWDCPLLPPLPPACHHHTPWCTVARHVDGPAGWRLVWPVGWTPSLPTSPTTFNHLLSRPRSVYVTGYKTTAKLIKPDAIAGASIVHVIDRVLIPDLSG